MPRRVYVYDEKQGKCVPVHERTDKPHVHAVHQDTMDPTWHPHEMRYYDSKSEFRRATKAAGLVEMGNDWNSNKKHQETANRAGRIEEIKKQIDIYESKHGRIG